MEKVHMLEKQTSLFEEFADCLHLILLPSKLWAFHIDSKNNFIAALHLNIVLFSSLNIDKGIVIWFDGSDQCLKVSFYINNELIHIPTLESRVKTITDISRLIYTMHNIKLCTNATKKSVMPLCQILVGKNNLELCEECEIYANVNIDKQNSVVSPVYDDISYDVNCSNFGGKLFELAKENGTVCAARNDVKSSSNKITLKSDVNNENSHKQINVPKKTSSGLRSHKTKRSSCGFLCEFCPKKFNSKRQLNEHLRIHTDNKRFFCKICNKSNANRSAHQRHEQSHLNVKPNLCSVCGKTFCEGYKMDDHLLTHSAEKSFECSTCKKRFAKIYNLKLHQKTHTGVRPYICSICGKTYTTQSNLSTHTMSVHTNKKPYPCVNCHMSFVHPHLLKIHMRKHTGERPYKCLVCGKTFAKNIHLTVHTRTHSGEKPHMCTVCGKGFTTTGNLSSHRRVHHKDLSVDVIK